ncbi:MAG TPA: MBL fold metallo-hydrolase [Bacillota bacterium]
MAQGVQVRRVPVLSRTLEPAQHTNTYLIGDGEQAVLIDAGFVSEDGLAAIDAAWRGLGRPRLLAILVTHGHGDHARGLTRLVEQYGAKVYAEPREQLAVRQHNPGLEPLAIGEGDCLAVAGTELHVLATPGHTAGHLSFWLPAQGTLFCGDVMAGVGTVWVGPPDGNMQQYLATLERLAWLAPARIGPGHGPWIERPAQAIAELIEHRLFRERQILEHLREQPLTARQLAQAIYAGQVPERVLPFAERTVLAHLDKLLAEGRVVASGPVGEAATLYRIV